MVVWMDGASKQRNQKLGKILFWREKNVGFESLEDQENHDYVMIAFNDSSFLALSQSWWAQPWLKGTNRKSLTYLPTYLPLILSWPAIKQRSAKLESNKVMNIFYSLSLSRAIKYWKSQETKLVMASFHS